MADFFAQLRNVFLTGIARDLQQATLEGIGAGPGIVRGLPPGRGQAIIPSGLGVWVALLEG